MTYQPLQSEDMTTKPVAQAVDAVPPLPESQLRVAATVLLMRYDQLREAKGGRPAPEFEALRAALSQEQARPDALTDSRDFDAWWSDLIAANGGIEPGADYRHWAEMGFRAAMQEKESER